MISKLTCCEIKYRLLTETATASDIQQSVAYPDRIFDESFYRQVNDILHLGVIYPALIPVIIQLLPDIDVKVSNLLFYYDIYKAHYAWTFEEECMFKNTIFRAFHKAVIEEEHYELNNACLKNSNWLWDMRETLVENGWLEIWINHVNLCELSAEKRTLWSNYPPFKALVLEIGNVDDIIFCETTEEKNTFITKHLLDNKYDITRLFSNYLHAIQDTEIVDNVVSTLKQHQKEILEKYLEYEEGGYSWFDVEVPKNLNLPMDELPFLFSAHNIQNFKIHEWSEYNKLKILLHENPSSVFLLLALFPEKREAIEAWYEDHEGEMAIEFLIPFTTYKKNFEDGLEARNSINDSLGLPDIENNVYELNKYIADIVKEQQYTTEENLYI